MDGVFPMLMARKKLAAEIVTVSCICGILFGCLCTPIIIYATSSDVPSITGIELDIGNCSQEVSSELYNYNEAR